MSILCLGLALLAVAPAHGGDDVSVWKPAAIYGLGAAADLASTELALARGARELNPLSQQRGSRIAVKLAGAAGLTVADIYLQRTGHRGWVRGLRIGMTVLAVGITVHNSRQGHRP